MSVMSIYRHCPTLSNGFTLLEILLALAVMAVLTGVAVINLRFDRHEQNLDDNVYQFRQFYRGARDQALLSGLPLRLNTKNKQLIVQQRQHGNWQLIDTEKTLNMQTAGNWRFTPELPIYLFPDGQSTPFRLHFFLPDAPTQSARVVTGDAMGRLTVHTP